MFLVNLKVYIVYIVFVGVRHAQGIAKLQLLGLFTFTNCEPEHEFECQNALLNEQRMIAYHKQYSSYNPNTLCTNDVVNSAWNLVNTILPIVEEAQNIQIKCRGDGVYDNKNERLIVITHVSFHLTRLASSILLSPEWKSLLICITNRPMYPAYIFEHPLAAYSFEGGFGIDMHENIIKLQNQLNITYAGILNIKSINETKQNMNPSVSTAEFCREDPKRSAMCYYTTENAESCIKVLDVNVNNLTMIAESTRLLEQNNITFVLLSGDSQSLQSFIQDTKIDIFKMKEIFYIKYVTKSDSHLIRNDQVLSYESGTVLVNFPGAVPVNSLVHFVLDLQESMLVERFYWDLLLGSQDFQDFLLRYPSVCSVLKLIETDYICGSPITYSTIEKSKPPLREAIVNTIVLDERAIQALIKVWKQAHYIQNINYKKLLRQQIFNPTVALKSKPYCELKKPMCGPGYQLVHSFYKEVDWTQSFGWNCEQCKTKFFKYSKGNSDSCVKCLYPNITNANRTLCFDPYRRVRLSVTDLSSIVFLITPSVIMLLLVFVTMIVFLIKKETPIVLSSNRHMTVVQLVVHALLFVIPNVIFFSKVSSSMCMMRQILLGFAFSITISINISKSQKIFMIVQKKLRMSRSEIFFAKASEYIIIMFVLCVDALLHALTFINKTVTIHTKYHDTLLIKEDYCSNSTMIYTQLLLASFLAACNGIQGFRARHIPSEFRETNHVIYSSFVSIVVSIAATVMYFSQSIEWRKEFIALAVTLLLNSVHFVLLYAYKMFIMIFHPQLNTKKAFVQKRLKKIVQ